MLPNPIHFEQKFKKLPDVATIKNTSKHSKLLIVLDNGLKICYVLTVDEYECCYILKI